MTVAAASRAPANSSSITRSSSATNNSCLLAKWRYRALPDTPAAAPISRIPTAWKPRSATRAVVASSRRSRRASPRAVTAPEPADIRESCISVGLRECQRSLGDEVEDHLAAHRSDAQEPGDPPHVCKAVLGGHAVPAVGLYGRIEGLQPGFRGRVL